jgi:hypothetical protein
MAITTNKIDDFIQQQVVDGSCATATEAAKEGRGRILNEESNREFLKKMESKLLDN